MTDVNAAFAEERKDQLQRVSDRMADFDRRVAEGKLVPNRGGGWRVNDPGSWDNGEVWFRSSSGLVIPQHGLDMTTGKAALAYSAGAPIWHSLGQEIPENASVDDVLKLGGIDFEVEQEEVTFLRDGILHTVPGQFVNIRTDTLAPLGVVGKTYKPFQNWQAFGFLQELAGLEGVKWESAGATKNGRNVFVSMRLPESVVITANGIDDTVDLFVVILNSHDGWSSLQAVMTPWRPICGNTERFALRDAVTRWKTRHTKNADSEAAEARRTLGLSLKYMEAFKEEEEKLAQNEMLLDEFRDLMDTTFPREEEETKRGKTVADKREDALMSLWGIETARVGRTAYAAERAFTGYWDNLVGRKGGGENMAAARATAVVEGTDDTKKNTLHKQLMLRVR